MVFPKEVLRHWAFCVPSPTGKSPDCHSGKRCATGDRPTDQCSAEVWNPKRAIKPNTTESPTDLTHASPMEHALQRQQPMHATRPGPEKSQSDEQGLSVAVPIAAPPSPHRRTPAARPAHIYPLPILLHGATPPPYNAERSQHTLIRLSNVG